MLPIEDALPDLRAALRERRAAVLQAPPGAGKTTRVPLALLDEAWLDGRRIVVLEPRRLAARLAARRMAQELGEPVGETVGFRVRMETRVSIRTRVEVVTEGVLTRMLLDDPALESVGLVVFDEFHERSLPADLGLALALQTQVLLRPDLRLLVMSATLDGAAVAAMLERVTGSAAPVVTSEGRAFPVETRYLPRPAEGRVEAVAVGAIRRALATAEGDVLAFLPGAGEIRRTQALLEADGALPLHVCVAPLYGDLSVEAQDAALEPSGPGRRKVVLATSIAETSLTVEGVRVVVDAGLARRPRFDPRGGMTRLETVAASRAEADQRRGRAGRTQPGVCFRLWTEGEHARRPDHALPEILQADLAPLALDLAAWGASPDELHWLDPPPAAALAQARNLLLSLGALDAAGRLTPHGRAMAALPMHPRLAHMALRARPLGLGALAADVAALLGGRDPFRPTAAGQPLDVDLRLRLAALAGGEVPLHGATLDRAALAHARREAARWRAVLGKNGGSGGKGENGGGGEEDRTPPPSPSLLSSPSIPDAAGVLLALAYPDRIAQRRDGQPGRYRLRNGRAAALDLGQPLADQPFLAVADLDARAGEARVFLAAPLALDEIEAHFADEITEEDEVTWDEGADAVRARRVRRLGALVLRERALANPDLGAVAGALLDAIRRRGAEALPWSKAARGVQERVGFLRHVEGERWPDLSDEALLASLDEWLRPYLGGMRGLADLSRLDLPPLLLGRLDWSQRAELDRLAPTHLDVPSGSRVPLDYSNPEAPVLAVRLQEVFGLQETPRVAGGRVPVVMHLLSPARRPVQVTRDLASFWRSGYFDVRKDLRGRYPKHPWPEDPLAAEPTARAKRGGR